MAEMNDHDKNDMMVPVITRLLLSTYEPPQIECTHLNIEQILDDNLGKQTLIIYTTIWDFMRWKFQGDDAEYGKRMYEKITFILNQMQEDIITLRDIITRRSEDETAFISHIMIETGYKHDVVVDIFKVFDMMGLSPYVTR